MQDYSKHTEIKELVRSILFSSISKKYVCGTYTGIRKSEHVANVYGRQLKFRVNIINLNKNDLLKLTKKLNKQLNAYGFEALFDSLIVTLSNSLRRRYYTYLRIHRSSEYSADIDYTPVIVIAPWAMEILNNVKEIVAIDAFEAGSQDGQWLPAESAQKAVLHLMKKYYCNTQTPFVYRFERNHIHGLTVDFRVSETDDVKYAICYLYDLDM